MATSGDKRRRGRYHAPAGRTLHHWWRHGGKASGQQADSSDQGAQARAKGLKKNRKQVATQAFCVPRAAWEIIRQFLFRRGRPGLVGASVIGNPAGSEAESNDISPDRVGTIMPLSQSILATWAQFLVHFDGRGRPCRFCGSRYHSRGGWYPFRSIVVRWEKRLPFKRKWTKREPEFYYKAGDEGSYDLVLAGPSRMHLPDYQGLLEASRQVDALLGIWAKKKGVPSAEVDKIIACEASFGHGLPLGETRDMKIDKKNQKVCDALDKTDRQIRALVNKRKKLLGNMAAGGGA